MYELTTLFKLRTDFFKTIDAKYKQVRTYIYMSKPRSEIK